MADYKSKKLIYHLTTLKNIPSILEKGLLPRNQLTTFQDVADKEIIGKRQGLALEGYVPFHWFVNNPFDGLVQKTLKDTTFVHIAVARETAAAQNWRILPRHPLANNDMKLLNYAEGFNAIEWETMNKRDYYDPDCKSVCMAECLAPGPVTAAQFFAIYVPSEVVELKLRKLTNRMQIAVRILKNENMFLR